MNILVVFTGGTIGSRKGAQGIDVAASGSYFLLDRYEELPSRHQVTFEAIQPCNLLSENLVPGDWAQLTAAIRGGYGSRYDGIIVTHGSDTLSFTAAMLSYLCCDAELPVVLTASNYPLEDARSNGLANFAASVDFIASEQLPGVFALFGNEQEESIVYLGTRITQALPFTDQFAAPYGTPYGIMDNGQFKPANQPGQSPTPEQLRARQPVSAPACPQLDSGWPPILYVKPYPGIDYSVYRFAEARPRAVLHDTYHSGTANTREGAESRSAASFITRCGEAHIDTYMVPMRNPEGDMYASSSGLTGSGGIPLERISSEAALMKLLLASALFESRLEVRQFMEKPLFYEFYEVPQPA